MLNQGIVLPFTLSVKQELMLMSEETEGSRGRADQIKSER